jgi:cell division protein FtsB
VSLGAVTYHRGRRMRGRRVPRWVVIGATAVAGVALVAVFGSTFLQVYRLEREAAGLERRKRDLEAQNAQLRDEIRLLHTPQYIEKLAREQLGLVKPGEIALLIVQPPPGSSPQRAISDDRGSRASPNGAEQRPGPSDAGERPSTSRPGWARRVWNAFRSLFP